MAKNGPYSEILCVIFGLTNFTVNIVLSGIMNTTLPMSLPTIQ